MAYSMWARPHALYEGERAYFVVTDEGQVFKWFRENGESVGFKQIHVSPDHVELSCDEVAVGNRASFQLSESWGHYQKQKEEERV